VELHPGQGEAGAGLSGEEGLCVEIISESAMSINSQLNHSDRSKPLELHTEHLAQCHLPSELLPRVAGQGAAQEAWIEPCCTLPRANSLAGSTVLGGKHGRGERKADSRSGA